MGKMRWPMWMKEIKWFIQRGKRGWADCDWWNLDSYISRIMTGAGHELLYEGGHLGCGTNWMYVNHKMSNEDRDTARRTHHLYKKMIRFFELHEIIMNNPMMYDNKELKRKYKASGLLLIRNFGRLWD